MKLTDEDRLNLIQTLSHTGIWELLPIQLNEGEVGLDRQRWEDMLQRLIDELPATIDKKITNKTQNSMWYGGIRDGRKNHIYKVARTLDIALEHGMAAEVMWSALIMAAEANEHGQSMEQVLEAALSEWDI